MLKLICGLFFLLALSECARNVSYVSRQNLKKITFKNHWSRAVVFDNAFNVYDPSFLSIVWPKISNGMHVNLGQRCWEDTTLFFKDLALARPWAYVVADASGRYQAALISGNRFWLGSKDQCLTANQNFDVGASGVTADFSEKDPNVILRRNYFDGGMEHDWRSVVHRAETTDSSPPYPLAYTAVLLTLDRNNPSMTKIYNITLGICLPKSCNFEDIASIINFSNIVNDKLKSNNTIPRTVKIKSMRNIENTYDVSSDVGAIMLITITVFLVLVAVVATLVDLGLIKCKVYYSKSMSFDVQKYNNTIEKSNRSVEAESAEYECKDVSEKEGNMVDMETLTINNINNSNNINMVTVKKMVKANAMSPSITLDVVATERGNESCKRCGKYKKQCANSSQFGNMGSCPRTNYSSFASFTTDSKKDNGSLRSILLCFSLKNSWKRVFNTNMASKNLAMVHCLRIAATFWMIFVQISVIIGYTSDSSDGINKHDNTYFYIITAGTTVFDVLFFTSGVFSSHHFFYLKSHYTVKELVSFGGACGEILQIFCFVFNRAIRLLPSYAYVILVSSVLSRASLHTSPVTLPEADHDNCNIYWWRNLLFINNFYSKEERCMLVSWYLSTEGQLHAACVAVCVSARAARGRTVPLLCASAALAAVAADLVSAYTDYNQFFVDTYALYSTIIDRPWSRLAPYFIGVFTGWLIHRVDDKLDVSKVTSWFLWCTSGSVVGAAALVPLYAPSWSAATLHAALPAALVWPAVFCALTTTGGWCGRGVAALSRLCYGALLLHGPLARYTLLDARTPPTCDDTLCIWQQFCGATVLSMLGALLVALLVELPACTLLRKFSHKRCTVT